MWESMGGYRGDLYALSRIAEGIFVTLFFEFNRSFRVSSYHDPGVSLMIF